MPISCENINIPMFLETELYIRRNFESNILMCDDGNKVPYCKIPSFYLWSPFQNIKDNKFGFNISSKGGEIDLNSHQINDLEVIGYIHQKICEYAQKRNEVAQQRPEYIKSIQSKMQMDAEFQGSELAQILQKPQIPYIYGEDTTTIIIK